MSKKIIVISKEFKTDWNEVNVDSRFYDEDMNPINSNGGVDMDKELYHLGQISSSFGWAIQDMSYQGYKDHFDKLFPDANGDFEFEFQSVPLTVDKTSNEEQKNNFAKPMLSEVHSTQREIDVQKLCEAVLETSPNCWDNPNGAYETSCPFCSVDEHRDGCGSVWASMLELKHKSDCAYLIAKDLSTNYR